MPPSGRKRKEVEGTSDYEKARDENIARNAARMTALGLSSVAASTDAKVRRATQPACCVECVLLLA